MEYMKNIWFKYFEPDAKPLCTESREILKNCVANSKCYETTGDFKKCMRENIDPDCIPFRQRYSACKRLSVDRTKDFRNSERTK